MIVTFKQQGRFGNNLFQYLATKIIQYYLGRNNTHFKVEYDFYPNSSIPSTIVELMRKGMTILPETQFKFFYESLKNGLMCNNINIMLDGYFQYDYLLLENQELIFDIINEKNNENITLDITVSNLVNKIKELGNKNIGNDDLPIKFSDDYLVMHLRLDDFINSGSDSFIIHPDSYIELINNIVSAVADPNSVDKKKFSNIKGIVIVCDKIKHAFETTYIQYLKNKLKLIKMKSTDKNNLNCGTHEVGSELCSEELDIIVTQGDMFEDFSRLFYAKNLICNNSTFCWISGFLGENEYNWMPNKNTCDNQSFFKLNDDTIMYDIKYINLEQINNLI
jgi:hypothetical protein